MTGQQLLTRAAALFGDTNTTCYTSIALQAANVLLAETFTVNNNLRQKAGKEPFSDAPELMALTDEIPFEDRLVKYAFPYGLAAKLFADDRDTAMLSYFHQQFVNAVNDCDRGFARVKI